MLTNAYLEPSQTSTMELFSLRLSHILKTCIIRLNCLFACVCAVRIVFFPHYFKYYGQNIFSRITVFYLIAKVERKE